MIICTTLIYYPHTSEPALLQKLTLASTSFSLLELRTVLGKQSNLVCPKHGRTYLRNLPSSHSKQEHGRHIPRVLQAFYLGSQKWLSPSENAVSTLQASPSCRQYRKRQYICMNGLVASGSELWLEPTSQRRSGRQSLLFSSLENHGGSKGQAWHLKPQFLYRRLVKW